METSENQPSQTQVSDFLQPDEKLIYSEHSQPIENMASSIFWVLFVLGSFPFFSIIAIAGIGGLAQGKAFAQVAGDLAPQFSIILVELIVLAVGVPLLCKKIAPMFPRDQKLVITDKRIFYTGIRTKLVPANTPVLETNFNDALFVATEKIGKQEYIKIKSRNPFAQSDEPREKLYRYSVSNASLIYSYLPAELTSKVGESSAEGVKELEREKSGTLAARIGMIVFVLAVAAFSFGFYLQETTSAHLKEGKKAVRQGDYKTAEAEFSKAYDGISMMPIHSYYGPSCYRLASVYLHNNKPLQAIPLFLKATEHCNYTDSDSSITWKPAVFRSYAKIALAYESIGDTASALKSYEKAIASMDMETDSTEAVKVGKGYAELSRRTGDTKKAAVIEKLTAQFVPQDKHDAFAE